MESFYASRGTDKSAAELNAIFTTDFPYKDYPTLGDLLDHLGINPRNVGSKYMFIGKRSPTDIGFPLAVSASLQRIIDIKVVSHHIGG